MKIDKVYIIHYEPLTERKKYLESILPSFNTPFEFRCKYNRNSPEINDNNLIDLSDENREKRNKIYSQNNGTRIHSGAIRDSWKACLLEHYYVFQDFVNSEYDNILILEDDVIFDSRFFNVLPEYLKVLPDDYDSLFLGSGCNLRLPYQTTDLIGKHPQRASKCGDSYMVSKKAAKKIVNTCLPLYCNWDWELNYQFALHNMDVYWVTEPLIYQGSENGTYTSSCIN